jgi:hypothetical protein
MFCTAALQGLRLLSAGADRSFRLFSTIQDQQSRELSQKHTAARAKKLKVSQEELKLPRVTQLAACEVGSAQHCRLRCWWCLAWDSRASVDWAVLPGAFC